MDLTKDRPCPQPSPYSWANPSLSEASHETKALLDESRLQHTHASASCFPHPKWPDPSMRNVSSMGQGPSHTHIKRLAYHTGTLPQARSWRLSTLCVIMQMIPRKTYCSDFLGNCLYQKPQRPSHFSLLANHFFFFFLQELQLQCNQNQRWLPRLPVPARTLHCQFSGYFEIGRKWGFHFWPDSLF